MESERVKEKETTKGLCGFVCEFVCVCAYVERKRKKQEKLVGEGRVTSIKAPTLHTSH